MKFLTAIVVALSLIAGLFGQELPIEVKGEGVRVVTVADKLPLTLSAQQGAVLYLWKYPLTVVAAEEGHALTIITAPAGSVTVTVKAIYVDFDAKKVVTRSGTITFSVGQAPAPDPGPTPPSPAPIPVAGFRVLIIHESAKTLPIAQNSIVYGKTVRDYLEAKCVVGTDGKTKEYRIYDKDVDASADSAIWQKAMSRPRTQVPWLIVSNGTSGYEGPLPASVAETMTLLKRYGE